MKTETKDMLKAWLIAAAILIGLTVWSAARGGETFTAFYTGERPDGNVTQCYYEYAGDTYIYTVRSWQLCPTTIEVEI